jgi:hypothetical protein
MAVRDEVGVVVCSRTPVSGRCSSTPLAVLLDQACHDVDRRAGTRCPFERDADEFHAQDAQYDGFAGLMTGDAVSEVPGEQRLVAYSDPVAAETKWDFGGRPSERC